MRRALVVVMTLLCAAASHAQTRPSPLAVPRAIEDIVDIPQTAPGAAWSFIGFGIDTPSSAGWFVVNSTPRNAVMGKNITPDHSQSAALLILSEHIDQKLESDADFLDYVRKLHARFETNLNITRHEETLVTIAGARCSRHFIEAQATEPPAGAAADAPHSLFFLQGLACQHPDDPSMLIELGLSEHGSNKAPNEQLHQDAEQLAASLHFDRYNDAAMQGAADALSRSTPADAASLLAPFIEAKAPWAEYLLAQILGRSPDSADRVVPLLHAAADAGVVDAQWSLGTLYLRGGNGVTSDPAAAEPLLRRAAEHGSAGAAFQLGLAKITGANGIAANSTEASLWIRRAAARGLKGAQDLLAGINGATPTFPGAPATPAVPAAPSTAPADQTTAPATPAK